VRDTLAFDAFARCWVQEHVLLERIGAVLPPGRQASFARLAAAWKARSRATYERSMQVLASQLAATATDSATLPTAGLRDAARAWLAGCCGRPSVRMLRPKRRWPIWRAASMPRCVVPRTN